MSIKRFCLVCGKEFVTRTHGKAPLQKYCSSACFGLTLRAKRRVPTGRPHCPSCDSDHVQKAGSYDGRQQWRCFPCGRVFVFPRAKTGVSRETVIPENELQRLYYDERLSMERIGELFGVGITTIAGRMQRYGLKRRPQGGIEGQARFRSQVKPDFSDFDKGWLSALIDGEGYVGITKERYPMLHIANTNRELMLQAQELLGGNLYHIKRKKERYRDQWHLQVRRMDSVRDCLSQLVDHLIVKREKAIEVLNLIDSKPLFPNSYVQERNVKA